MKNIQYLFSVLFLINCSHHPSQIDNDLNTLDLKGEVETMVEYSYPKTHRYWNQKDYEYSFDSIGFTKRKIEYRYNTYKIFEYDKNNNISRTNQYDSNDSLVFKSKFEYKNQKLLKQKVLNSKDEIVQTAIYDYSNSANGMIIVNEKGYNSKGDLIQHSSNIENQKGQDLKWNEYNLKGKIIYTNDLTYNEKGKVVEYVKKDSINNLKWKWNKVYNADNLEVERILYNPKLDKENIRISSYEFDHQGNWIIKYLIQNKDTLKTFKREIKYFE